MSATVKAIPPEVRCKLRSKRHAERCLGKTASDFMVNRWLKLSRPVSVLNPFGSAAACSIHLEIAVGNDKTIFEAVAGDFKCRRTVQRRRHDALERDTAKTLLAALIVIGSECFDPCQRQGGLAS